jgi:hypothetical protein
MEIFNRLKISLEETGLVINNDKGASNLIIIALAEAFQEGIKKGEISGRIKVMDNFQEVFNQLKN